MSQVQVNGNVRGMDWTELRNGKSWDEIATTDALEVAAIAKTYIQHVIYQTQRGESACTPEGVPVAESDLRAVLEFQRAMTHPTPAARVREIVQRLTGAGVELSDRDRGALEFCASAAESIERKAS